MPTPPRPASARIATGPRRGRPSLDARSLLEPCHREQLAVDGPVALERIAVGPLHAGHKLARQPLLGREPHDRIELVTAAIEAEGRQVVAAQKVAGMGAYELAGGGAALDRAEQLVGIEALAGGEHERLAHRDGLGEPQAVDEQFGQVAGTVIADVLDPCPGPRAAAAGVR